MTKQSNLNRALITAVNATRGAADKHAKSKEEHNYSHQRISAVQVFFSRRAKNIGRKCVGLFDKPFQSSSLPSHYRPY